MAKFLSAFVMILLAGAGFEAFRFLSTGPGQAQDEVVFEVPAGVSFHKVASELESKGLIQSALKLRVLAKISGQSGSIKRGEYALNKAMTPQEILSTLVSGKSIQYPVTFPEGSNAFEMAAIIESKKLFKADEFLALIKDKKLIQELLGIDVSSLEGYLFPETYHVTKFTPLRELLASMVQNFKANLGHIEDRMKAEGKQPSELSRHELVTLASIVEKETGAPEERPMIASVFFNRLKKNMKLQSDPTIIYGIWVDTGKYKKNITKEDILKPTRYNTYTVSRLPWGPIGNPGRESLAAVLSPAKSDYLYFVSRNDGTHIFTRTYEEHLKAVKSFQLDASAREGKSWRDLNKVRATSSATR